MNFDWTIHASDLIVFSGGIIAFVTTFLRVRDALRDLTKAVGTPGPPPTGLMGDVHHIKSEQREHRDWLVRAGLDQPDVRVDDSRT